MNLLMACLSLKIKSVIESENFLRLCNSEIPYMYLDVNSDPCLITYQGSHKLWKSWKTWKSLKKKKFHPWKNHGI